MLMSGRTVFNHVGALAGKRPVRLKPPNNIERCGHVFASPKVRCLSSVTPPHSALHQNEKDDKEANEEHPMYRSNFLNHNSIACNEYHNPYMRASIDTQSGSYASLCTKRSYHASVRDERAGLVLGLGAVALTAKAGQYAVRAYEEYKASSPPPEEKPVNEAKASDDEQQKQQQQQETKKKDEGKRENVFHSWFGTGTKYYEGGFEEKMTRREAALILGVRESSSAARIKNAHRKILILNHPDTGGSTYIASKLNEAKELLLKGKED